MSRHGYAVTRSIQSHSSVPVHTKDPGELPGDFRPKREFQARISLYIPRARRWRARRISIHRESQIDFACRDNHLVGLEPKDWVRPNDVFSFAMQTPLAGVAAR